MNFVPSLCWVKQGAAMNLPHKVKLRKEELKQMLGGAAENQEEEEQGVEEETEVVDEEETDIDKKYNMDDYDDEESDVVGTQLSGLAVYPSSKEDPNLSGESDDSDDEKDAFEIQEHDNLIVVGRVDEDCAVMEVYVYNDAEDDLYVHHDIILPAYPLCMEWLNFDPTSEDGTTGNYVVIGDMTPVITMWNLDIVDTLDPVMKLGKKEKKKKKNKLKVKGYGHKDAVISVHWNRLERNILASGSADHNVIIWDLRTAQPTHTIIGHEEKVQSVRFHPFEAPSLLSAGADHCVRLWDIRDPTKACRLWKAEGEIEKVIWDHFSPFHFYAAAEPGHVLGFDVRNDAGPVFTLAAHEKSVTCMSLSNFCPGLLVTGGEDELVKVWDVEDKTKPKFVLEQSLNVGELLSLECAVDQPFVISVGGDEGDQNFRVMDLMKKFPAQMQTFAERKLMKVVDTIENKKSSAESKVVDDEEDDAEMEDSDGDL